MLSILEDYNKIVIWIKNKDFAYDLAKKLNIKRCVLIRNLKTPYECFLLGKNLKKIIKEEQFPLKTDSIIRFKDLRDEVYNDIIQTEKNSGLKVCKCIIFCIDYI